MPVTDTILEKMDNGQFYGNCIEDCVMPLNKIRTVGKVLWQCGMSTEDPVMDGYDSDDVQAMGDIFINETDTMKEYHEKTGDFIRRLRDIIRFLSPRVPDIDQVVKEYVKRLVENDAEALQDKIIIYILNTELEAINDRSKKKAVCQPA